MQNFPWLALLYCLLPNIAFGQNYIDYQQQFNRIDEDLENKDTIMALLRVDSIFDSYDFIYARHCIKALQISCSVDDSLRAERCLVRCFTQGVPMWILRTNGLTQKVFQYQNTAHVLLKSDSLYAIYHSKIDWLLAKQIDSLMRIDQYLTAKVNHDFWKLLYFGKWKKNNRRQFLIIKEITEKKAFPGERLLGLSPYWLDSTEAAANLIFYGPNVVDQRAFIMLVHYYSHPRTDINNLLFKNVCDGYLPPEHFGALNDFMARFGKKQYRNNYYNVWHKDKRSEQSSDIEERRLSIGLNTSEAQEKNLQKNRGRRLLKIMNLSIIME